MLIELLFGSHVQEPHVRGRLGKEASLKSQIRVGGSAAALYFLS